MSIKEISALDWYVIHAVKKLRMDRGLSQSDLSFQHDFSDSFVAQMESEQTPAHYNIAHLNAIARVLKCKLYDFFPKHPLPENESRAHPCTN